MLKNKQELEIHIDLHVILSKLNEKTNASNGQNTLNKSWCHPSGRRKKKDRSECQVTLINLKVSR